MNSTVLFLRSSFCGRVFVCVFLLLCVFYFVVVLTLQRPNKRVWKEYDATAPYFNPGETKQKRFKRIRRYSAVFLFFIVTNVTIGLCRVKTYYQSRRLLQLVTNLKECYHSQTLLPFSKMVTNLKHCYQSQKVLLISKIVITLKDNYHSQR